MNYDLDASQELMNKETSVMLIFVYIETSQMFIFQNIFTSNGVLENPATVAAMATFIDYLRDIKWLHGRMIDIVQGEDMAARSLIKPK